MGYVASGLITGIVSARAVSGYVGEWWGWRSMFFIVAGLMLVGLVVTLRVMPQVSQSFHGTYRQLMSTVGRIFISQPRIRLYSLRPAMSFACMMSIWSCMAFHLAGPPFHAGSDVVGMLGLFGESYAGLIIAIILADIGAQCLQVANQSSSLRQLPEATDRVNTIFMTTFFIGGSLGTFFSGLGWSMAGWIGVCLVGGFFACASFVLSAYERFYYHNQKK